MERMDDWIDEYCKHHDIEFDHYYDFEDELELKELNIKFFKLIEEHCEKGYQKWSTWFDEYDLMYPIFTRLLHQRYISHLMDCYKINTSR